jgi:3-methyladenine DNA glycosylase AlkD
MIRKLQKEFRSLGNEEIASHSLRFFKTGKGEYGEGDIFLGIRVPVIRKHAKTLIDLPLKTLEAFIESKYHEERLLGLIVLVNKFNASKDENEKSKIYKYYISKFKYINNWDLVDVTCPHIVGKYLFEKDRKILYKWAKSKDLWTKRIAMISNWWFIRNGDLKDVYKLSEILLEDEHDLIHKAVGWMLREAAKKDFKKTEVFLKKHYKSMPRTMLRYAIEQFPEKTRQAYLKGTR